MAFKDNANAKVYFRQGAEELVEDEGGKLLRSFHRVAAGGSTIANVPQLSGHFNLVTGGHAQSNGVKLPEGTEGMSIWVRNENPVSASGIKVFPKDGVNARIDRLALSGAYILPGSGCVEFVAESSSQWWVGT